MTSGIYQFHNIKNQKRYIGSAVNLCKRHDYHVQDLRHGKHVNKRLQRAWDKYGPKAFAFEILEIVHDKKQLITREQHYLDITAKSLRYNICDVAGSSLGVRRSKMMRQKLSLIHQGSHHSIQTRQKMSNAHRGRKKTDEHARAIMLAHCCRSKLTWKIVRYIRAQRGKTHQKVLACRYGISQAQVSRIMRNEDWREAA